MRRWKRAYGAHPLHLLVLLMAFALAGYTVWVLGFDALWNHQVWWQAIAVWFVAAIIAHDLILFPAYALVDRILAAASARTRLRVSPLNYVRVPLLGIGLSFLLFFPGIIRQGAVTYHAATGGTQQPFLQRWLLLSAALLAVSAIVYAIQSLRARRPPSRSARD
ncbi:hypothetical protein D5S18_29480 [Nocardia panacis]|uniref:Uncharacterized protein n=1 Tax=Nocardia panacis TaxID=2340916 RepID=A0A3A4JV64_9NOCA|nr:hypothetical protein D5S18_29480 [Nocardia panacis]